MTTMPTHATRSSAVAVRRPRGRLAEHLGLWRRPRTGPPAPGPLQPPLLRSVGTAGHATASTSAFDPAAAAAPAVLARLDIVRGATAGAGADGGRAPRTDAARRTRIDAELLRIRPRIF